MANTFTSYVAKNVGTTPASLVTVASATQTTVIGLTVSNTSSAAITTDIYVTRASVNHYVARGAPIGVGTTFVAVGGDQKLVLTTSDALVVATAGTNTVATTAASGTGSTATISFAAQAAAPSVGSSVIIAGVTPVGYNGTYTVTASTTTSVSFASSTTGAQTVAGTAALASSADVIASVLNIT